MSEDQDEGSKTEEASDKKLKKSREKGEVPVSKEVGHLMGYGSLFIFTAWLMPRFSMDGASALGSLFTMASRVEIGTGRSGMSDIAAAAASPALEVAMYALTALMVFLAGALLSGLFQGPFVVALERVKPKGSKLSPLKGAKKIFGANNLVEFAKNFVKLVMVGAICLFIAWMTLDQMLPGAVMAPEWIPPLIASRTGAMLAWVVLAMLPIVLFDAFWSRFSHAKKQRMSMKDIKDEHKESEGDPLIKGKRQQIARQRSRRQIRKAVPEATLIVTNPTHFAVALRYERGIDAAPVCVAKGADLLAHQIRSIAHENEIPVIESRQLARALYAAAEIEQTIPEIHWPAVAELVRFVYDLRDKVRRRPPEGASLRLPADDTV